MNKYKLQKNSEAMKENLMNYSLNSASLFECYLRLTYQKDSAVPNKHDIMTSNYRGNAR